MIYGFQCTLTHMYTNMCTYAHKPTYTLYTDPPKRYTEGTLMHWFTRYSISRVLISWTHSSWMCKIKNISSCGVLNHPVILSVNIFLNNNADDTRESKQQRLLRVFICYRNIIWLSMGLYNVHRQLEHLNVPSFFNVSWSVS